MPVIRLLLATAALLLVSAPTALAGQLVSTKLTAQRATDRACHARLLDAGGAVVHRRVTVPSLGLVRARLSGARGADWDLGVFNREGRAIAGSAHFGSRELAEGFAGSGQRVTVQACRRSGRARQARLTVANVAIPKADPGTKVQLVRVLTPSDIDKDRLLASGLDVTEHGRETFLDVMLYGDRDLSRLEGLNLQFAFLSKDVFGEDRAALRQRWTGTPAPRTRDHTKVGPSPLPSGRTNYRRLADYSADLKLLAEQHPDLVRPITLPHPTHLGRPVEGVVITSNPDASAHKPAFVQFGVHHAREWPSAEMAIEWAFEMVNSYGSDERATKLLDSAKTIVVPVVNPDGFNLTREMPFAEENLDSGASEVPVDSGQPVVDPGFAYKRRNCHVIDLNDAGNAYDSAGLDCADVAARDLGVDPNRNYGGLWGGPGATEDHTSDTFYGPGPFSEPETQNVQWLVSNNQATTLITNHTYSDLILRPPGIKALGDTIDEQAYKALGAAMAEQNGYTNWQGFELYDTTGTTEDWSYFATGGFGFTFEIGRAAQSVLPKSGEPNSQLVLDIAGSYAGVGFHPPYPLGVVSEWLGKGPWAGKGNREAYYTAFEAAADAANHSVIAGKAEPGTELTLSKTFPTSTSPRGTNEEGLGVFDPDGTPIRFQDTLTTTMTVPASGTFEWHVNPSTRPGVLKGIAARPAGGPTTPNIPIAHDPEAPFYPNGGAPIPGTYEEVDFEILPTQDNGAMGISISWPGDGSTIPEAEVSDEDLDLYVYRQNAAGDYEQIGASTQGSGTSEAVLVPTPAAGKYRVRVSNYTTHEESEKNWSGEITFTPPVEQRPALEAWTLTCRTAAGESGTESLIVGRGERIEAALGACQGGAAGAGAPALGAKPVIDPATGAVLGARRSTGRVSISKRRLRINRRGYTAVRLACSKAGPCVGVLRLTHRKRVLGKRGYALAAGQRGVVRVKVARRARKAAARRGGIKVVARAGTARRTLRLLR